MTYWKFTHFSVSFVITNSCLILSNNAKFQISPLNFHFWTKMITFHPMPITFLFLCFVTMILWVIFSFNVDAVLRIYLHLGIQCFQYSFIANIYMFCLWAYVRLCTHFISRYMGPSIKMSLYTYRSSSGQRFTYTHHEAKPLKSIMLPPPCMTTGKVLLGLKASKKYLFHYWQQCNLIWQKMFLQKTIGLFVLATNFNWAWMSQFLNRGLFLGQQSLSPSNWVTSFTVGCDIWAVFHGWFEPWFLCCFWIS